MLNVIMDYRMVPPLSALSLALCHEALEGGGNHKMIENHGMGTILRLRKFNGNHHMENRNRIPIYFAKLR